MPNIVVVVKETYKGFFIEEKYGITEITQKIGGGEDNYDVNIYGIGSQQN